MRLLIYSIRIQKRSVSKTHFTKFIMQRIYKKFEKWKFNTKFFNKHTVWCTYKIPNLICSVWLKVLFVFNISISQLAVRTLSMLFLFLSLLLPLNLYSSVFYFPFLYSFHVTSHLSVDLKPFWFIRPWHKILLDFISVSVLPKLFYSIENHRWQNDSIGMSIT